MGVNNLVWRDLDDIATIAEATEPERVVGWLRNFSLPRRLMGNRGGTHPVAGIQESQSLDHSIGAVLSCKGSGTVLAAHIASRLVNAETDGSFPASSAKETY